MSGEEEKLYNEIFLEFHPILFAYGKKLIFDDYLVEECIQELFIYLYEKEIDFKSIKNTRAYLFTAARRRILTKKQSSQKLALSSNLQFNDQEFSEENENNRERNKQLAATLNDLPWRQREAVYLKYFNQLSTKEIAEIMGIKPQVVSNTIYKAIKKVKENLTSLYAIVLSCASAFSY